MESTLIKPELSPYNFTRIRFQDCDPFGHLNNARYMDYFIEARSEHLRESASFDFYEYGNRYGKSWVVSRVQIQYLEPVRHNDIVKIMTRLIRLTPGGITNEALLFDKEGNRLKATAWVDFTFVDLAKGRPARHDQEIFSFLESCLYKDEDMEDTSFEARVKQLRKQVGEGKYSGERIESP
ncbi:acyl-CoA thioesterase [Leptospira semungkisensis]|uniref:Acyl-CoA thioesterase n=1 Tax=Leptospira semungkisensis TaxID=2484985 RepID=A0A4R9G7L6_9LEPT|nr:acyl-CoA thioesterase [Leptospira semungkisensis]TGK06787.1 acyl-CoA thioesterase [Leptospira semungkisensis]